MVTVQHGAMLKMLAGQNAGVGRVNGVGVREFAGTGGARAALFATSMGLIVLMAATMVFEYTGVPNMHHSPLFFQISGGIFPLLLLAVARAGGGRYPATIAAATYTVIMLVMSWILALVPAVPMLAPIYNPITRLIPPGFPILLIVPALAIDLLHRRLTSRSDWLLAASVGVVFVLALLAVQWPFASFLLTLEQPNYLFGTGYWEYHARLGPWTRVFFDVPGYTWNQREMTGALDVPAMARAVGIAILLAVASSRLGIWWGEWMRRVRR
ncbi:MAG: hypothetical protein H7066_06730 [Cytophagaceae bacterium]|nr:hypothetical protein [Gemmatimonadaceae bacterium]